MEQTEKKQKKNEIEILPVKDGVVAVDDWCAYYAWDEKSKAEVLAGWDIPEEDRIFKARDKSIIVEFDKYFKVKPLLNNFYLRYKDSYISKVNLITHYINYFLKYYDEDKELLLNYFYMKYHLDKNYLKYY